MLAALVSAAALAVLAGQDARPPQSNVVQNTANIAAGERLVIRQTADGIEAVQATRGGPERTLQEAGPGATPNSLVRTAPGTIAFSLGGSRETGSLLMVENATGQTIAYDAYIVRYVGGQAHGPHRTRLHRAERSGCHRTLARTGHPGGRGQRPRRRGGQSRMRTPVRRRVVVDR